MPRSKVSLAVLAVTGCFSAPSRPQTSDATVSGDVVTGIDAQQTGCSGDDDCDGVADAVDTCPGVANDQDADFDMDSIGDACDPRPQVVGDLRQVFIPLTTAIGWTERGTSPWSFQNSELRSGMANGILTWEGTLPAPPFAIEVRLRVLEAIDANQVFTLSLDTRVNGTTFVVGNSCELQDSGTGDQLNAYRYQGSDSAANVSPSLDALEYVGLFAVVESPTVLRCMLRRTASTVEWSRSDIDYLPSRFGLRAYYADGAVDVAIQNVSVYTLQ